MNPLYLETARRVRAGDDVDIEVLVEAAATLEDEVTELGTALGQTELDASDKRVVALLDLLRAISLKDETDSASAWKLATALGACQREAEAAMAFLAAEIRFRDELAAGDGVTGDEGDWAAAALFHACSCLVRAEQPVVASLLARRLPVSERLEILAAIEL